MQRKLKALQGGKNTQPAPEEKTLESGSFSRLSDSLMKLVTENLESDELVLLSSTCKRLNTIGNDTNLWRKRSLTARNVTIEVKNFLKTQTYIVPAVYNEKGTLVPAKKTPPKLKAKTYKEYVLHAQRANLFLRNTSGFFEVKDVPPATLAAITSIHSGREDSDFSALLKLQATYPNSIFTGCNSFYLKGGQLLKLLKQAEWDSNSRNDRHTIQACLRLYAELVWKKDMAPNPSKDFYNFRPFESLSEDSYLKKSNDECNQYISNKLQKLATSRHINIEDLCRQTLIEHLDNLFPQLTKIKKDLSQLENLTPEKQTRVLHSALEIKLHSYDTTNLLGKICSEFQQNLVDEIMLLTHHGEHIAPAAYDEAKWRFDHAKSDNKLAKSIINRRYWLEDLEDKDSEIYIGNCEGHYIEWNFRSMFDENEVKGIADKRLLKFKEDNDICAQKLHTEWTDQTLRLGEPCYFVNTAFMERFNHFMTQLNNGICDENEFKKLVDWERNSIRTRMETYGLCEITLLKGFIREIAIDKYPNLSRLFTMQRDGDLSDLLHLKQLPRKKWLPLFFAVQSIDYYPNTEYSRALDLYKEDPEVQAVLQEATWRANNDAAREIMRDWNELTEPRKDYLHYQYDTLKRATEELKSIPDEKEQAGAQQFIITTKAKLDELCEEMKGYGIKP